MQRAASAVLFTFILLASGCLGLFEDEPVEEVGNDPATAPEMTLESVESFAHDERVVFHGIVVDDDLGSVSIRGDVRSTEAYRYASVAEDGVFVLDMGTLPVGLQLVTVTASNAGAFSDIQPVFITILAPPEDPVAISAMPATIYGAEGESISARATVVHEALDTCAASWSDSLGRELTASVSDGIAMVWLGQLESSYNGTLSVSCGSHEITTDSAEIEVVLVIDENPDLDGDGIPDAVDGCIESRVDFDSDASNDMDGDGCHDQIEDEDDDADQRIDAADRCARGLMYWDSTDAALDWDSDGCKDDSEDTDDDSDTILDIYDNCPRGAVGWASTGASDYDRDGCRDATDDLDDDNDGTNDVVDNCPNGIIGWVQTAENDFDGDGCRDADEDGDDDSDGVPDVDDWCNQTRLGESVNAYGCALYEWDDDDDGVTDDNDTCPGTPLGLIVNTVGCADLDGDGIFANVDQCPDSEARWTADANGCTILQNPVVWQSSGASTARFGTVADFTVQTKFNGNWKMSRDWDGKSTYLFIFNQDSNSYMASLWSQNVGRLLEEMPENTHVFFGSFDSDYRADIDAMNARVNSYRNGQNAERQMWVDDHVHYIDQQGGTISGGLGGVIGDWSSFYYGIDREQQWREIGSLSNWAGTHGVNYRFDYIGKMGQQFNAEFNIEMRRNDPGVTVVDLMVGQRHQGGWGGGHWSLTNGSFPNASVMAGFNTMELYMHHGCSESRDRYTKADSSKGGCHEWDYDQYLNICSEAGNSSSCGTEFGRWITTYGREGRWLTDISPRLFELTEGEDRMFRYKGANGGWLNVSVYLSNWEDDGTRPTDAQFAFTGGAFRGQYNNESQYTRRIQLEIPENTVRVEIYSVVTGHGFGKDDANCAEFCNHEHRFTMNGHDTQEDHPMAGNSTVNSDREGCAKEMDVGAVANQLGSWPYGRAGWCAGADAKPWTHDITDWVDFSPGATNELVYQGLYNGQNYVPQNEQSGANQAIRMVSWIVYYTNATGGISASMDDAAEPLPSTGDIHIVDIVREEEIGREQ